jgi:hypothetical protein
MPQKRETPPDKRDAKGEVTMQVLRDDRITGMLLDELLKTMGYDVCAIESTEGNAVIAAARCRPDMMIVDVQLAMEGASPLSRKYCAPAQFHMSSSAVTFQVFKRSGLAR